MISYCAEKNNTRKYELQEVVILLPLNPIERFRTALAGLEEVNNRMFGINLITQIGFILTRNSEYLVDALGSNNQLYQCLDGKFLGGSNNVLIFL